MQDRRRWTQQYLAACAAAMLLLGGGLGGALSDWQARAEAEGRLLASLERDEERELSMADARQLAALWAEEMGLVLERLRCVRSQPGTGEVWCEVLGEFADTQPQLVALRCLRQGCFVAGMGISAMPAP